MFGERPVTFAQQLESTMRKKGLSAQKLADLIGYKSKTTVVRILREESVHAGREKLFAGMKALGILTAEEQRALYDALEVSRVGPERALARAMLRAALTGRTDRFASPSRELSGALEMLCASREAKILLLNCCWQSVILPLREVLEKRPNCTIEHYVSIPARESVAMAALCAMLNIACMPAYSCYTTAEAGADTPSMPQSALCISAQDRDGQSMDVLISFRDAQTFTVLRQPSEGGLFDFMRSVLQKYEWRRIVSAYDMATGPETLVQCMHYSTQIERDCHVRAVKPVMCINEVEARILRDALTDGGVLRHFPQRPEKNVLAMLDDFLYFQEIRYDSLFSGSTRRRQIHSARSQRRFALTGKFDMPFHAIRPFTVPERISILENYAEAMLGASGFSARAWNQDEDMELEVYAFEGVGILSLPSDMHGWESVDYQASMIRHPRLLSLFEDCFDDDLERNCTLSMQDSRAQVLDLISMLRASL